MFTVAAHRFAPRGVLRAPLFWSALLVLGAAAPALGQQQEQGAVTINAEGFSSYRADDVARSREEAIEAAQRDAVEQASGVFIQSESTMKNFELVKDEVLARSKGFIKNYKVVQQRRDRELYRVSIEAQVVRAAFIKDMGDALENLYRRIGKPRVLVAIKERMLDAEGVAMAEGDGMLKGVAEKEIRKILIKQGFTMVDARAAAGANLLEVALKGNEILRDQVVRAARTTPAEIVILGNAAVQAKGAFSQFQVAQTDLSLDVIRVDNGQVMASEVTNARGLNIQKSTAAVLSIQKAAQDITPAVMEQVSYQWIKDKNEGARIELVISNISFGALIKLRKALSADMGGVKKVLQRSYKNKVALIELTARKTPQELAEGLFQPEFESFGLEVESVSSNRLVVKVVKP